MSEPIQSIAQNNYILATQQEVSHDSSLSGNGMADSPLGVVNPLPYPVEFVSTTAAATAQNVIYVVTGTNS